MVGMSGPTNTATMSILTAKKWHPTQEGQGLSKFLSPPFSTLERKTEGISTTKENNKN